MYLFVITSHERDQTQTKFVTDDQKGYRSHEDHVVGGQCHALVSC